MAFFSIVIPLYNKEQYIKNTLDRVLEQTFQDFEIVIVNDGSTDKGPEIVKSFNNERIKYFEQENKGVSAARNLGIEKASGTLIALLDADDSWLPNHLETLFKLYEDFPNAGMYCSRYKIKFSESNYYVPSLKEIAEDFRGLVPNFFDSSFIDRIAWTSAVAIPKTTFNAIGNFNTDVSNGQDLELWIRIAIAFPVALSDQITAIYHYEIEDSLAKRGILNKKLMDFSQFSKEETQNASLKKFLDIYRIEYALHFHMFGDDQKMRFYLKDVDKNTISKKTKILFALPAFVLQGLLKVKHGLKKIGINFTVYH